MNNFNKIKVKNELKNYYHQILNKEPQDSDLNFWVEKMFLKDVKRVKLEEIKNHFEYCKSLKQNETKDNDYRQFPFKLQNDYAHNKFKEIKGFLNRQSAIIISSLSKIQNEIGVTGGIGEIGVHHGRLFMLLHLMLNKGERSFCVDVFEKQDLNIDSSGRGSYEKFNKNIQEYGNPELVDIFSNSSLNLLPNDIISKVGKVRILSIDGGHTPEVVDNDFHLGESVLAEGGIIILDDYFNPAWPGVSEGTNKYFLKNKTELIPFAYSSNKLFFTNNRQNSIQYSNYLKRAFLDTFSKNTKMFDCDVICLEGQKIKK